MKLTFNKGINVNNQMSVGYLVPVREIEDVHRIE
jgi:hypothetical protein